MRNIWLGKTALSDAGPDTFPSEEIEKWCSRVAAELLVPEEYLKNEYKQEAEITEQIMRLARYFKASILVIIRRLYDPGYFSFETFRSVYSEELNRLLAILKGKGGNFYLTQAAGISKRFARALVISTLEGQTLHREAFQLLGFSKYATFRELGKRLGVM